MARNNRRLSVGWNGTISVGGDTIGVIHSHHNATVVAALLDKYRDELTGDMDLWLDSEHA